MATYTFVPPLGYPAGTANQSFQWIDYDGRDLLGYKTPRGDPNPVYDRFVGYLDVDWVAVNAAAGTPLVYSNPVPIVTVATPPPVADLPITPTATTVTDNEPKRARDGDDLILSWPNGSVDRFPNYFAPTKGTTVGAGVPPNPNSYAKPHSGEQKVGNDKIVTLTDGTQKVLTNWYLPFLYNSDAYANGAYMFGTGSTDPEWMVKNGSAPAKKWLSSDRIEGNDRVAVYSDGTSLRDVNWVTKNPDLAAAPTNAVNLFDTENVDIDDYIPPVDVFIDDPRNTDNVVQVATPVVPEVTISTPFPDGQGISNGATTSVNPRGGQASPPRVGISGNGGFVPPATVHAGDTPLTAIAIVLSLILILNHG